MSRSMKFALLLLSAVLVMLWRTAGVSAAGGVATSVYPQQDNASRTTWMNTELCPESNKCMRGQNTVVSVFVPIAMVGSNYSIKIVDGCDDTGNDVTGYIGHTDYKLSYAYSTDVSGVKNSDEIGCPNNRISGRPSTDIADINLAFNASSAAPVESGYYKYDFVASARFDGQDDGWGWYYNAFKLEASDSRIIISMTGDGIACDNGVGSWDPDVFPYPAKPRPINNHQYPHFKHSCPTTGVSYSTIAAYDGSGAEWSQEIRYGLACNYGSYNGTLVIYDADHKTYQNNMRVEVKEYSKITGAFLGVSVSDTLVDGGNDATNSYNHLVNKDSYYIVKVSGIGNINSLQIKLPSNTSQLSAGAGCGSLPRATIAASCDSAGKLSISINASDPDGGSVAVSITSPVGVASQSGSGAFSFGISGQASDGVSRSVTATVADAQNGQLVTISAAYICPVPPPSISCIITPFAAILEPGDTYTPQLKITHTGAQYSPSVTINVTVTVDSQTRPKNGIVVAQGASQTVGLAPVTLTNAGIFTVSGSVSGTVSAVCAGVSVKVMAKPYLKAYGGDVGAGGGLCSAAPDTNATIKTFDRPNGAGRSGSSSEYAAFAYAAITASGFYTKSANSSATGDDLTFANNIASPGGNYSAQPSCEVDYYSTAKPSVITSSAAVNGALCASIPIGGAGVSTQYDVNPNPAGRFTLDNACGGAPGITGKVSIFVNGNVQVNGDITYSNAAVSSPDKLPSFTLVATGNIYIRDSVRNLAGIYIAQRGTIYSCATNFAAPQLASSNPQSVMGICNNQLTVHGAFMAKNIRFLRAQNTLKQSSTDTNPNKAVSASYSTSTKAAEVFVVGPEMYLSQPAMKPRQSVSSSTFDGIASLAPIF